MGKVRPNKTRSWFLAPAKQVLVQVARGKSNDGTSYQRFGSPASLNKPTPPSAYAQTSETRR